MVDILEKAREAGLVVLLDGQIGREKYQSVSGSLDALRRFVDLCSRDAARERLHQQIAAAKGVVGASIVVDIVIDGYAVLDRSSPLEIRIMRAPYFDGPDRWKVMKGRDCLSKQGAWVYEPLPSSRTDAFLKRCRFDTDTEAIEAAIAVHRREASALRRS